MKVLVNEKLSPHRFKTPEGYLICTDAILARTGKQTYLRREVFGDSSDRGDEEIEINRDPKEVFSDATLASFENKPLTIEHPNEDVNPENHRDYSVGFIRDIKRGKTTDGEDVMLGTIVVTDSEAIKDIENGELVELSCGYDCDVIDEANPQQRNIRGNHVALCQHGRAGIARIVDSVKEEQPSIKALGKWEWDEVMQDWYDNGRHMYYNEIMRRSAGKDSTKDSFWRYIIVKTIDYRKGRTDNYLDGSNSIDEARYNKSRWQRSGHDVVIIDTQTKKLIDSVKDVNDLTKFKMALRNISKMYSNDPGIEYVMSVLKNLGYEVTVDSIDGWKENKNVPGEHVKQYRMNVMLEGKEHHFLVQLYADMGEWKVKEINAYMLDSNNIKQGEHMKDEDFSKKTKQGYDVIEMYRDGGRLHAIVKRGSDYVVALGYDTSDGTWAQGRYVGTYEGALSTLKEEKPTARKIQDAIDDAKTEYVFNWQDTYHNIRDKTRVDANNIKEAIKKFGDIIGLGGLGTANCYVISISPNDGYLRTYGKLSDLLKTFKDCETKDEFGQIEDEDFITDMPIRFKPKVNLEAFKSNVESLKQKYNNCKTKGDVKRMLERETSLLKSLKSNFDGALADIEEFKKYNKSGEFDKDSNALAQAKKLTSAYQKLLFDPVYLNLKPYSKSGDAFWNMEESRLNVRNEVLDNTKSYMTKNETSKTKEESNSKSGSSERLAPSTIAALKRRGVDPKKFTSQRQASEFIARQSKDSLKKFKIKYTDSKGRQVIHIVKATSLADAMHKVNK